MKSSRISGVLVLLLIVLINLAIRAFMNRPHSGLPWLGSIKSVSFAPYQKDDNPLEGRYPTPDEIEQDIAKLAGNVDALRTYTAREGMDVIPGLAARYGLTVTAGIYLGGMNELKSLREGEADNKSAEELERRRRAFEQRLVKNEIEVNTLLRMVRENNNITRLIVGNEALLTASVTPQQLIRYIDRIKEKTRLPVSTAEPPYIWIRYPELVQAVDYITIHILPYWEGITGEAAITQFIREYERIEQAYPGKPIFVGEVGWPSAGKSRFHGESLVDQALFLRRILNLAEDRNIDINVIEAFDQPWKRELGRGTVEGYWGIYDSDRNPKFSWVGPVIEFQEWPFQAAAATILALLPVAFFLFRWDHLRLPGKIFFAVMVQFAASLVIWSMSTPVIKDFAPTLGLMFAFLIPAQLLLLVVVLISAIELTELTWSGWMKRRFLPYQPENAKYAPKVSLHLPCYNEPAEMVKVTLDSLNRLNYENFEVLVIDNNTRDPNVWRPVQEYCAQLGPRFKFFSLGQWPGAKAGALNFALTQTAPDAEVIGVVDSDYIVDRNWLRSLTPYFENPKTGWVQAPQDHRDWQDDPFKEMINWEYAGFFDIGMVFRNEANAIIQHGTMTLIRRKALEETGLWAEWCIVEDAELGLRMLKAGYDSVYIQERQGHGLVPDSFMAYKKQRFRWAYGAVQILKAHWKSLIPFKKTGLSTGQKYHFVSGWLPWLADAFYLLFTVFSVFWSVGMVIAPRYFDFPLSIFVLPTVGVFVAKLVHHLFLYQTRVKCSFRQRLGAAIAGMGLTYSIARAMWQGIFTKSTPFMRTPKMANKAAVTQGFLMAAEETALMVAQWISAGAVLWLYTWKHPDARLWAGVLIVQSMPFLASLVTSMISVRPKGGFFARQKPIPAEFPVEEKEAA